MRPRIVIDARMIGFSGIGTYVQELLNGLRSRTTLPFDLSLVGNPKMIPSGPWSVEAVSSPIYTLQEQLKIPWAFSRLKADLMHSPHYNMPMILAGRTVVTVHDLIHLKFPQQCPSGIARAYARFFFHHVIPKARAIMADSESTKRDLMEMCHIPGDRISVVYLAVDHERFRQRVPEQAIELKRLGLPPEYLLYIGNLRELKNVRRLVNAYQTLRSTRQSTPPLVLVGRNFIPGFDHTVSQTSGIHLVGVKCRDNLLPCLYQNAMVFLFPSLYEGFGLPPLEAMASGTPVMCSDRGSLAEVVGDAALLVNPESIEEMTAAMKRLIDEPQLRKELSAKETQASGAIFMAARR